MPSSTSRSGWRGRSTGFLASVAAIALIVALAAGVGIGYKIEQSRTKADVQKAKKQALALKKSKNDAKTSLLHRRIVGVVAAATPGSVTITLTAGGTRTVEVRNITVVAKASAGAASDVAAGNRVLVAGKGSLTVARALIVLPKTARLGQLVSAVAADTMTLRAGTKTAKIAIKGATVYKVAVATMADVTKGASVMIETASTKAALVATEIIVLPSGTAFN